MVMPVIKLKRKVILKRWYFERPEEVDKELEELPMNETPENYGGEDYYRTARR